MARMAAASASALRRRSPRSWARAASSSARAFDSAAAFSRASVAAFSRLRSAPWRRLARLRWPRPWRRWRRPWLGLASRGGRVGGGAFSASRSRALRASCSSRSLRLAASSSSWRRISSAWRRASSSRRASSALSCGSGAAAAARRLGRLDHGRVGAFVTLDEGALLAHFHLDGAGLAGGVRLLDLAGGLLHQGDLLALGRGGAVAGLEVAQQLLLVGLGQRIGRRGLGHACAASAARAASRGIS
jgi:hypothetical protein